MVDKLELQAIVIQHGYKSTRGKEIMEKRIADTHAIEKDTLLLEEYIQ